jgi:hypothetical protein
MMRLLIMAGAMLAATPALAQQKPLDAGDAEAFLGQLREMGYVPGTLTMERGHPITVLKDGDNSYALSFSGCTGMKKCRYVTMVGAFTDVVNPPADWVAKENRDFDLIKVWVSNKGTLIYGTTTVIEGWPGANFRSWMALFRDSEIQLAVEARNAKLIK